MPVAQRQARYSRIEYGPLPAYPLAMALSFDVAETGLPPVALVQFVEQCLDIDDKTVMDFSKSPITPEVFAAGWDRFSILHELIAKRLILRQYQDAATGLQHLESLPPGIQSVLDLATARARAQEAGRAFTAIAATYQARHGYGKALQGVQEATAG